MLKKIALLGLASSLTLPALAEPTTQNTVAVRAAFEFSSIDPSRAGFVFTRMQILETLVDVDDKGNLIPALAASWEISNAGTQWDFTLRDGVQLHNGTALDATIVAANLNLALSKPGALQGLPITGIEAVGKQQVRVTLSQPFQPLGAVLAHYSASIMAPAAFDEQNNVQALIGTGPFSVYEIAAPHRLVVKRFADYWGKKAQVEYANYLTGHRAEARVLQARSGQGDIVFGLDPAAVPMLKRLPNLDVIHSDLPRTLVIKLNLAHPNLDTIEERQALSLAMNRQGIATAVLRSADAATDQLLPDYMGDWHVADGTPQLTPDLAKASSLMQQAGWQKNADGWLEQNGEVFELDLITYADRPELTTVATAIQDQWKQLGVKLNVNVTNSSAIPAGHQDGSLEVALMARNYGSIADPLGVLVKDFGSETGGDWGSMNWRNPSIQTILNNLVAETDPQRYHQQAQQVANAIYTEMPMIPVASYVQQTAVNKRLDGFRFDPYERSYFLNELVWTK